MTLVSLFGLVLVAVGGFLVGYTLRDIRDKLVKINEKLFTGSAFQVAEPKSSIIEPREETPAERAKREQEELIERLNPQ